MKMNLAEYFNLPEYRLHLTFGDFWYYRYYNEDILINHKLKYKKVNTNLDKNSSDSLIKQLQIPITLKHQSTVLNIIYDNQVICRYIIVNAEADNGNFYVPPSKKGWYIRFVATEKDILEIKYELITPETHNIITTI